MNTFTQPKMTLRDVESPRRGAQGWVSSFESEPLLVGAVGFTRPPLCKIDHARIRFVIGSLRVALVNEDRAAGV